MDMVNDRKTTAANAPEEIRRAKNLHIKLMNKRRQNPHLGKDDLDDVSSGDSAGEGEDGFEMPQPRGMNDYNTSPPAVPVVQATNSSPDRERQRIVRATDPNSSSSDHHYDQSAPSPLLLQIMKFWDQHHQQVEAPYQQQLLEQLRILQEQNQQIITLLTEKKNTTSNNSSANAKKRARENEDHSDA
jgi:hypothetical protein